MKAKDIMQRRFDTIHEETLVGDARKRLEKFACSFLPVYDDFERVIGVVTDSDMKNRRHKTNELALVVRDIASPKFACCFENQNIEEIAGILHKSGQKCVLVLNRKNELEGILSERDVTSGLAGQNRAYACA